MTRKAVIGLLSPVVSRMEPPHYKFQKLDVYQLGLDFVDKVYGLASKLPESERFNLCSQIQRASTSIVLNIAEGSTGQTDLEQSRFLGMALRSYLESVACIDLIERRRYLKADLVRSTRELGHRLFVKLQAFRRSLRKQGEAKDRSPSPVPSH